MPPPGSVSRHGIVKFEARREARRLQIIRKARGGPVPPPGQFPDGSGVAFRAVNWHHRRNSADRSLRHGLAAEECQQILEFIAAQELSKVFGHGRPLRKHDLSKFLARKKVKIPLRIHHL